MESGLGYGFGRIEARGDAEPGGVPAALYRHPAWVAWKEASGWRFLGRHRELPVFSRAAEGGVTMAYGVVPAGFLGGADGIDGDDDARGARLEALSLALLPRLGTGCAFIRWDLMDAAATDGSGARVERRLAELRMNASTSERRFRKSPVEHTAPDTMLVRLDGGADAVRARFDARTRYALRLAERRGTAVVRGGAAALGAFHALYRETAERRGFPAHGDGTFRRLLDAARVEGLELSVLLALAGGEPAAAAIFAREGRAAWYLFAGSSARHREAQGPAAILARAMADAAGAGARVMDLLGAAPAGASTHPLAGLTRFKGGFGGERAAREGAWDFVLDREAWTRHANACQLSVRI